MARIIQQLTALLLAPCFLLSGSGSARETPPAGQAGSAPVRRIVSLAPSNTELLFSLGAGGTLVGVSAHCDFPPEARKREVAGSFTGANMEKLALLKPDLILLVSGQESLASLLKAKGFAVRVLDNSRLEKIPNNISEIGQLTGRQEQAARLAAHMRTSLNRLQEITGKEHRQPAVLWCVWPEPLMVVGGTSFLNDEITAAGGRNVAAGLRLPYPRYSTERLLVEDPEIIVLPNEAKAQALVSRQPWSSLSAVRAGRVHYLPSALKDDLSRPTLRSLSAIHWLAVRIHPGRKADLDAWLARARLAPDCARVRATAPGQEDIEKFSAGSSLRDHSQAWGDRSR